MIDLAAAAADKKHTRTQKKISICYKKKKTIK